MKMKKTAVVLTYTLGGTTRFTAGGILTLDSASGLTLTVLFALFALGSMKAAWMPFHSWLPSAMVAPTPVSSLLHAVAVVKAGVFGFVRIVCYIFGIDLVAELGLGLWLGAVASLTMIVGSLLAIAEDNLKRRLAYSTISQLSYALMVVTGKKKISQMAGVGKQMPVTMIAFTIGAIGMCGAPPVSGFISKWFLGLGAVQSGYYVFLGVLLVSSLLDVVYFFPVVKTAFFDNPSQNVDAGDVGIIGRETQRPLYLFMVIPLALTAVFSVVFCFFPGTLYILDLVEMAIDNLF
jgi:formate hydrogenlyase subunit 3/multisubunit Na+/H+ antiporter MnhD subunit